MSSKKYLHEPKSQTTVIPEESLAFTHNKKVEIGSFIKARVRIRPDLDPQHCYQITYAQLWTAIATTVD
jgi:hypothetical protein